MSKTEISVEALDLRCDWIFPDSLERCWIMPTKLVKGPGGVLHGKYCEFHAEDGAKVIAQAYIQQIDRKMKAKDGDGGVRIK